MWKEFKDYLLKQNLLALALAVVIGVALNRVVQAIVNDIIMPVVSFATPGGDWEKMKLPVGPIQFGIGDLLSALLNFIIIGFVAWRITKLIPQPPAPATKVCQFCKSTIDPAATRCPHCTSQLA
jgi:large conductance mechanosensitive channel